MEVAKEGDAETVKDRRKPWQPDRPLYKTTRRGIRPVTRPTSIALGTPSATPVRAAILKNWRLVELMKSLKKWLSPKDSNLDASLQRAVCYRYTRGEYEICQALRL